MANYLVYPTAYINMSQNYNDGIHAKHSSGSPADYPIDECSVPTRIAQGQKSPFLCPCDKMKIVHIYGVNNSNKTNTIWIESTSPVVMPCGNYYITIMVTHPEDDDLKRLNVGQEFTRNQIMFYEGRDGNATGDHFHISIGTGKFTGSGWVKNSQGAWVLSTTGVNLKPEQAFYRDPARTIIEDTRGLSFELLPSETTTPEDDTGSSSGSSGSGSGSGTSTEPSPPPEKQYTYIIYNNQIGSIEQKNFIAPATEPTENTFIVPLTEDVFNIKGKKYIGIGLLGTEEVLGGPGEEIVFSTRDFNEDGILNLEILYRDYFTSIYGYKKEKDNSAFWYQIKKIWCYDKDNSVWINLLPYVYKEYTKQENGINKIFKQWYPLFK